MTRRERLAREQLAFYIRVRFGSTFGHFSRDASHIAERWRTSSLPHAVRTHIKRAKKRKATGGTFDRAAIDLMNCARNLGPTRIGTDRPLDP